MAAQGQSWQRDITQCEGCLLSNIHTDIFIGASFDATFACQQGYWSPDRISLQMAKETEFSKSTGKVIPKIFKMFYDSGGYLCGGCLAAANKKLKEWEACDGTKNWCVTSDVAGYDDFVDDYSHICSYLGVGSYYYNSGERCCVRDSIRKYGISREYNVFEAYSYAAGIAGTNAENNFYTGHKYNTCKNITTGASNTNNNIASSACNTNSVNTNNNSKNRYNACNNIASVNTDSVNVNTNKIKNTNHSNTMSNANDNIKENSIANYSGMDPFATQDYGAVSMPSGGDGKGLIQSSLLNDNDYAMETPTNYAYHSERAVINTKAKAPNHFSVKEVRSVLLWLYEHPITSVSRDGQMKELSTEFTVDYQNKKNKWLVRKPKSYIDLLSISVRLFVFVFFFVCFCVLS